MLVATEALDATDQSLHWDWDRLAKPLRANPSQLATAISRITATLNGPALNPAIWFAGGYRPTPTIVDAAQAPPHLKALRWRPLFQAICDAWEAKLSAFKINPHRLIPGPHT